MVKVKSAQKGITLTGVLLGGIVIALVALMGMKVLPTYLEYGKIKSVVKLMGSDGNLRNASVADVRTSFNRRAEIDGISSITGQDLDIGKEGGRLVIKFAYSKKVPLFSTVSLMIDYQGTSGE